MLRLTLEFSKKSPDELSVRQRSYRFSVGDVEFAWRPSWVRSKVLKCYTFLWFGLIIWNKTVNTKYWLYPNTGD